MVYLISHIFESIICLGKTIADKTQDIDDAHFLWNCTLFTIFKSTVRSLFFFLKEYYLLCRSVYTCSSICQFATVCLCEYRWQCAFATGDTHAVNVFQLCFQAFQRDESGFSRWIVWGGESQPKWAVGTWGQRPDGLGLQCSLLSPCLINKVNTGRAVQLLGLHLLLIGSKHSQSAIQCAPPRCVCVGLDEQGYDGDV